MKRGCIAAGTGRITGGYSSEDRGACITLSGKYLFGSFFSDSLTTGILEDVSRLGDQ